MELESQDKKNVNINNYNITRGQIIGEKFVNANVNHVALENVAMNDIIDHAGTKK